MLIPLPLIGLTKPLRFLLLELPRERERNKLARREERIEFLKRHDLVPRDRSTAVALLAEGKSIRRALRACEAEHRDDGYPAPRVPVDS